MTENLTSTERLDTVMKMLAEIAHDFRCEIVVVVGVPSKKPDGEEYVDSATGVFGSLMSDPHDAGEACLVAAELLRNDGERLMRDEAGTVAYNIVPVSDANRLKS